MVLRRIACSMSCWATACSVDMVAAGDATTTRDTMQDESGSDGPAPDLPMVDPPAEPECPAGLGEVVACECAVVDGCTIPHAGSGTGCMFACDVASPCPEVVCTFNSGRSWPPSCEADLDVAALQCVFDALAEAQPLRWSTRLYDTYGFAWDNSLKEFLRLDATTYVRSYAHHTGNDADVDGSSVQSFAAFEIPESAWLVCDAMSSEYERFECLHALAGQPCVDPSALFCP